MKKKLSHESPKQTYTNKTFQYRNLNTKHNLNTIHKKIETLKKSKGELKKKLLLPIRQNCS